jgi:hypothetical protein
MAGNARFHNKFHRRGHHTDPSTGYPDSGTDPIASQAEPFLGDFHLAGSLSANKNLFIGQDATILGNLSVMGDLSYLDTIVSVTSALSVVNFGTGPALTVVQHGAQPIAKFIDKEGTCTLLLDDGGLVGFNTCILEPGIGITINNTISSNQALTANANIGAYHFLIGSVAEGRNTRPTGTMSHTEGDNTIASNDSTHAEGYYTSATGQYGAHAEGAQTRASGLASHAEGNYTEATGDYSHAAGVYSNARYNRSWVWHGSTNTQQVSTTRTDQFMVSAAGGIFFPGAVGIGTDSIANALTVNGNISGLGIFTYTSPNYGTLLARNTTFNGQFSALAIDPLTNLVQGRLGINTAPVSSYALHVKGGNIRVDGVDYSAAAGTVGFDGTVYDTDGQSLFDLRSGFPDANYSLSIAQSGLGNFMKFFGGRLNDDKAFINVKKNSPLRFGTFDNFYGTNYEEHMRIGRTGNIGIHTNHPWVPGQYDSSANEALTVNGNISANGTLSATGAGVNYFAGNVGIGTNTPEQALHVLKASAGTVIAETNSIAVFEGNGSNHISILTPDSQTGGVVFGSPADNFGSYLSWNYNNNALKLATDKASGFIQLLTGDEAEAVRITSSGNVGIGTTVPAERLTVSGNISANGSLSATGAGMNYFAGNVGVGTAVATEKLTVSGNISASGNLFINSISSRNIDMLHSPANDGTNPVLRIGEIDFATGNAGFSGVFMSYNESTNVFGISSQFAPGAGLPVLSIDRFSNVGIDTDTPNEALTVNGSISSNATVMTNVLSARFINLVHTPANDGANPYIGIGETDNATGNAGFSGVFMSYNESTNVFGISSQFAPAAGTPALAIDRFGRTGVGTEAPAERLTVAGNVSALSAVYTMGMQPIGFIPFVAKTTGFNLLGAVNTRATVYTVPGGMRAMATGLHIVITNAVGTYTAGTMPSITLYAGSVSGPNQMIGLLALDDTPNYTAGRTSGTHSVGGNRNTSTSTIIVNIDTAAAGTSYTTLEATVYTFGYLIS